VELDYGGLVHALSAEQLAADRSAAEVAEGGGAAGGRGGAEGGGGGGRGRPPPPHPWPWPS
ncbi:hypothetical protein ACFU7C_29890, partial [Streptomyces bacillaris]